MALMTVDKEPDGDFRSKELESRNHPLAARGSLAVQGMAVLEQFGQADPQGTDTVDSDARQ